MILSVIIPANNEAPWIGSCLGALFASDRVPGGAEAIVVANGCTDDTAAVARTHAAAAAQAGWGLKVLDLSKGGKPGALNAGDAAATGAIRAYLDADVTVSPGLMTRIVAALSLEAPAYASGRPLVAEAKSPVTRAYARFWSGLPFAQSAAPGFGLFAVNAPGRARWGDFPAIISDDTFVRLNFAPGERIEVPATYTWPMIEGFARLVAVRRRQDAGVAEVAALYPQLRQNAGAMGAGPGLIGRALRDPVGFTTYAAVALAVRLRRSGTKWTRGR